MSKLLIKNTNELKQYVSGIPDSLSFKSLEVNINAIQEKWLKPVISKSLLNYILELIEKDVKIDDVYMDVIDLCRYPMAQILMRDSADLLNINITAGGFTVNNTQDRSVASANRVLLFKEQLTINAQMGMDSLFSFLEENADELSEYRDSDERKERKKNFINTTAEFNTGLLGFEIGNFVFEKLRHVLSTTESRYLQEALGSELFADMKSKIANSEHLGAYAPILPYIQRALPGLVLSQCIHTMGLVFNENGVYMSYIKNANEPQQTTNTDANKNTSIEIKMREYAKERMEDLSKHLIDNASIYPLFESSTAYSSREITRIESVNSGVYFGIN